MAIVTTVVYVRDELHLGDSAFAWSMGALGEGSSLASIILARRADGVRGGGGAPMDEHLRYHRWARRTLLAGGMMLGVALLPGFMVPGLGILLLPRLARNVPAAEQGPKGDSPGWPQWLDGCAW